MRHQHTNAGQCENDAKPVMPLLGANVYSWGPHKFEKQGDQRVCYYKAAYHCQQVLT